MSGDGGLSWFCKRNRVWHLRGSGRDAAEWACYVIGTMAYVPTGRVSMVADVLPRIGSLIVL